MGEGGKNYRVGGRVWEELWGGWERAGRGGLCVLVRKYYERIVWTRFSLCRIRYVHTTVNMWGKGGCRRKGKPLADRRSREKSGKGEKGK